MMNGKMYREKKRIGIALRRTLVSGVIGDGMRKYFGCTALFLKAFFESQFEKGMTWENFGKVWGVGHVIPVVFFDLKRRSELMLCWNWANLKPILLKKQRLVGIGKDTIEVLEERALFFPENMSTCLLANRAHEISYKNGVKPSRFNELRSKFHVEHWRD